MFVSGNSGACYDDDVVVVVVVEEEEDVSCWWIACSLVKISPYWKTPLEFPKGSYKK